MYSHVAEKEYNLSEMVWPHTCCSEGFSSKCTQIVLFPVVQTWTRNMAQLQYIYYFLFFRVHRSKLNQTREKVAPQNGPWYERWRTDVFFSRHNNTVVEVHDLTTCVILHFYWLFSNIMCFRISSSRVKFCILF